MRRWIGRMELRAAVVVALAWCGCAAAQQGAPVQVLHPSGGANDQFGGAVAVDGDTMVVGAQYDDVGANADQGSAHVYRWDGSAWVFEATLLAGDGAANAFFGCAVAVSCDTVVVGSRQATVGGVPLQGAAYVFTRNGSVWMQEARLTAQDGGAFDFLGNSVAIEGGTIVAGAPGKDNGPSGDQGAVYVFTRAGTVWSQQAKLLSADGAGGDYFGFSVSISGETLAAGAPLDAFGADLYRGSAYVFTREGGAWTQRAKLAADDGAANDLFGWSVSISGDTVVAGEHLDDVGAATDQGSAFVFVRSSFAGPWTQQAHLTMPDGASNDFYGTSVSVSGDTIAIGVPGRDVAGVPEQGSVQVYTRTGTVWTQRAQVLAPDGSPSDQFGSAVALRGDTLVAGAIFDKVGSNLSQGSAWVCSRVGSKWVGTQMRLVPAGGGVNDDRFGRCVAISGNTAVVGTGPDPGSPLGPGAVSVYVRSSPGMAWVLQAQLTPPDGISGDRFGYSVAIDGDTIAVGSPLDWWGFGNFQGSVYIYTRSGEVWTLRTRLDAGTSAENGSAFGFSVALWGGRLFVGAPDATLNGQLNQGAAFVYIGSGASWMRSQVLQPIGASRYTEFGTSMSCADGVLVVGSNHTNAYIFRYDGVAYAPEGVVSGNTAYSVSTSGGVVAVGSNSGQPANTWVDLYTRAPGLSQWGLLTRIYAPDGGTIGGSIALSGDELVALSDGYGYRIRRTPTGWDSWTRFTAPGGGTGARIRTTSSVAFDGRTVLFGDPVESGPSARGVAWSFDVFNTPPVFDDNSGVATNTSTGLSYLSVSLAVPQALEGQQIIAVENGWPETAALDTTGRAITLRSTGDVRVAPGAVFSLSSTSSLLAALGGEMEVFGTLNASGANALTAGAFRLGSRGGLNVGPGSALTVTAGGGSGPIQLQGTVTVGAGGSLMMGGSTTRLWQRSSLLATGAATVWAFGGFDCEIDSNARFDLSHALLQMRGTGVVQTLEAMSTDVGASESGFDRSLPGRYPLGTLRIGGDGPTTVQVVDARDNDALGQGACEAVYVDTLRIEAGAHLVNGGCSKVYYRTLVNDGVVDVPANLVRVGVAACGPADIGATGGVAGADGALNNNDFVVFIDLFFSGSPAADIGVTGGVAGTDGRLDNNDFIVFIDLFFSGC